MTAREYLQGLGSDPGYPTTGRVVSLDELNAGYQAHATPNFRSPDPGQVGTWNTTVGYNLSLDAQRQYVRSLYDAAVNHGGAGPGTYYEPNYPAYDYSGSVPGWAQPFLAPLVAESASGPQQTVQQIVSQYPDLSAAPVASSGSALPAQTSTSLTQYQGAPVTQAEQPFTLASIPTWLWLVAAGVAAWFFFGGSDNG